MGEVGYATSPGDTVNVPLAGTAEANVTVAVDGRYCLKESAEQFNADASMIGARKIRIPCLESFMFNLES